MRINQDKTFVSTYRVLDAAVGLEHLVDGVPGDPGVVAVLLLVVIVGVAGPEGLHLGALPLLLHVGDQLLPRHLNRLHRLPSHRMFAAEYRSFCKICIKNWSSLILLSTTYGCSASVRP